MIEIHKEENFCSAKQTNNSISLCFDYCTKNTTKIRHKFKNRDHPPLPYYWLLFEWVYLHYTLICTSCIVSPNSPLLLFFDVNLADLEISCKLKWKKKLSRSDLCEVHGRELVHKESMKLHELFLWTIFKNIIFFLFRVQSFSCVDNMRMDGQLLTSGYTSFQGINKPIGKHPRRSTIKNKWIKITKGMRQSMIKKS